MNKGETSFSDQRTLCLGEIRSGQWVLPVVRPFHVDGRLHFATWKDGAMVTVVYGRDRLVAVTGEGSFRTPPLVRPQKGIALNADTSQGWMEATLCDRAGDPVRGASACRIEGIEGASISLPWKQELLPMECVLCIRLGDGAKVFGVAEK